MDDWTTEAELPEESLGDALRALGGMIACVALLVALVAIL